MSRRKLRYLLGMIRRKILDDLDFMVPKKLSLGVVSIGWYFEYEDGVIELRGYDIGSKKLVPRYVELSPVSPLLGTYVKSYDTRQESRKPPSKESRVETGEEFLISEEKVVFRHPRDYA